MDSFLGLVMVLGSTLAIPNPSPQLVTCPGFAGYCSEAYPGDTCTVVCAFGRNNVPQCQPDGTWTDVPRCIEHEPGHTTQRTGLCPGVPGYCSDSPQGTLCEFNCLTGPDIKSFCTKDGTWDPYPVCDGDIRETRDGCDGCPGPFGEARDRKKEAASAGGSSSSSRTANNRPRSISQQPKRPQSGNRAKNTASTRKKSNRNNRPSNGNNGRRKQSNRRNNGNGNKRKNGASQSRNNGNRGGQKKQTNNGNKKPSGNCPEAVLEKCIAVCPSNPIKLFGLCVEGCAKRC